MLPKPQLLPTPLKQLNREDKLHPFKNCANKLQMLFILLSLLSKVMGNLWTSYVFLFTFVFAT
jgi:hypothetical protein